MSKKRKNCQLPKPSFEVVWAMATILGLIIGFICGCLFKPFGGDIVIKILFLIQFTLTGAVFGFAVVPLAVVLGYGVQLITEYVHDFIQSVRGSWLLPLSIFYKEKKQYTNILLLRFYTSGFILSSPISSCSPYLSTKYIMYLSSIFLILNTLVPLLFEPFSFITCVAISLFNESAFI